MLSNEVATPKPKARPINPPTTAPTIPKRVVTINPPESGPGITAFAKNPAKNPRTIQINNEIIILVLLPDMFKSTNVFRPVFTPNCKERATWISIYAHVHIRI